MLSEHEEKSHKSIFVADSIPKHSSLITAFFLWCIERIDMAVYHYDMYTYELEPHRAERLILMVARKIIEQ